MVSVRIRTPAPCAALWLDSAPCPVAANKRKRSDVAQIRERLRPVRDRTGPGWRPGQTRRLPRGSRDGPGCLRSSSAVLRGSRQAGQSPHRSSASPSRRTSGLPGTSSSGWRTYGTSSSFGCRVQALTPASASDAPISFRKLRRPTGSSHSDAFCGNSRWRKSLNSGVSVSDSRLRQYSRPRVPSSRVRSASMLIGSVMRVLSVARGAGGVGSEYRIASRALAPVPPAEPVADSPS